LFAGDFNFVPEPLARFEDALKWSRLDEAVLVALARKACGTDTGLGITTEELAGLVSAAGRRAQRRVVAAPERGGSCYFPENEPALTAVEQRRTM
jgi:hypothetical protein